MDVSKSLFIWIVIILIVLAVLTYLVARMWKILNAETSRSAESSRSIDDSRSVEPSRSVYEQKSDSSVRETSNYVVKPKCPICQSDSNNQSIFSGDPNTWNTVCENSHIFHYTYIEESDNYRIVPGLHISDDACNGASNTSCGDNAIKLICKLLYASVYYSTISNPEILDSLEKEDIKSVGTGSKNMLVCPLCNEEPIMNLNCVGSCSFCKNRHTWHSSKSIKISTELSGNSEKFRLAGDKQSLDTSTTPIEAHVFDVKAGKCPACKYNDWRLDQIDESITPEIIEIFKSGRCPAPEEVRSINQLS
jgi:hypothetical protein